MKIAIHHRKGSFSERWIEYCKENSITYKIVNAYSSDIIKQIEDCDAFMWHHHHGNVKDLLIAKELMFSLEQANKIVFPDFKTAWHFDDKIGQKYLFESINAPLVPTYVSYDMKEAIDWANNTVFPKVFKLRGGAGASNVRLVKNKNEAKKIIKKAFSKGFPQFDRWNHFFEKYNHFKNSRNIIDLLKGFYRLVRVPELGKKIYNQKGYVYFQDFIPNNKGDIRIIVINKKAFVIHRLNRKNDFRASGSGIIDYPDNNTVNFDCLSTAFKLSDKIGSDCVAFDFVLEKEEPLVVEISYSFTTKGYDLCKGYWDENLNWFPGKFNPQEWMVNTVINLIQKR